MIPSSPGGEEVPGVNYGKFQEATVSNMARYVVICSGGAYNVCIAGTVG